MNFLFSVLLVVLETNEFCQPDDVLDDSKKAVEAGQTAQPVTLQEMKDVLDKPLTKAEKEKVKEKVSSMKSPTSKSSIVFYDDIEIGRGMMGIEAEAFGKKIGGEFAKLNRLPGSSKWHLMRAAFGGDLYWEYDGYQVTQRYKTDDPASLQKLIDDRKDIQMTVELLKNDPDNSQWTIIKHTAGTHKGKFSWEYKGNDIGPTFSDKEFKDFLSYRVEVSQSLRFLNGNDEFKRHWRLTKVQLGDDKGKVFWEKEGKPMTKPVRVSQFGDSLKQLVAHFKSQQEEDSDESSDR